MTEDDTMKPGRERTKAWIYSVINPLLDGLRIEASFLAKRNWTFRRYDRGLEFIRPSRGFVDYQSLPNWEDFTTSNPHVQERLVRRDERREELRRACEAAFDYLVAIPGFKQKVSDSFDIFAAETPAGTTHLVQPNVKPHEVIAELVVNNVKELPDHYGLHRFWLRFRDELMPYRVGPAFEDADQAGLELKKANNDLSGEFMKVRSDLAAEYDIPWAPYYDESLSLPGR